MAEYVLAAGAAAPDKDALLIVSENSVERWRYRDIRGAVLNIAGAFDQLGLTAGDRILMRLGNTVDFPLVYLGALAAGMVPVPTSPALTEAEVAKMIDLLKPAAVVCAPEVPCPPSHTKVALDDLKGFAGSPRTTFHQGDPERPGYIVFSSGTAGQPRAVVHAHRAIWARRLMFQGWYDLRPDDRVMHAGAFNWTYTMGTGLMDPWTVGATALIAAPGTDIALLPDLLRAHDATLFAVAPGVYRHILDRRRNMSLPTLRHGLSAGEKLPPRTAARWHAATGRHIYEAYGMSECSTFVSQPAGSEPNHDTIGKPQSGRQIAILKDDAPVARGTEGTIAVHQDDPGLMLGYLESNGALSRPQKGDWFLTGDQAIMAEDDQITYLGRNDDMMNAGGFRVSPLEVEAQLSGMPGVDAIAVTEVSIKQDTTVIAAFYTGAEALDDPAWHAYVQDKLARYKQPRLYIHKSVLPLGGNGKILRRALRDDYERQHG